MAKTIAIGGITVGVLDTVLAIAMYRVSPFIIYQAIAGGFYGKNAYQLGWKSALIGVFVHFLIATVATALYVVASKRMPVLVRRGDFCGPLYGAVVYGFMNYVVIPFSAIGYRHKPVWELMSGLIGHLFLVGLPIGLVARRASRDTGYSSV